MRIWLDVVLFMLLVALCSQLALPAIRASRRNEAFGPVAKDAQSLYKAFQTYRERNGSFPDITADPPFDPVTLEPLRRRGYYDGKIEVHLLGQRVDAYDAPDDRGENHEFWLEMTLASDPSLRLLIAYSDDAPLGRGKFTDGVFLVANGRAERL